MIESAKIIQILNESNLHEDHPIKKISFYDTNLYLNYFDVLEKPQVIFDFSGDNSILSFYL